MLTYPQNDIATQIFPDTFNYLWANKSLIKIKEESA